MNTYDEYIRKAVGFRPPTPKEQATMDDGSDAWNSSPDAAYERRNGEMPVVSGQFQPPSKPLVSWDSSPTPSSAQGRDIPVMDDEEDLTPRPPTPARTQTTPKPAMTATPAASAAPAARIPALGLPVLTSKGQRLDMGGWEKPENEVTPKERQDKRTGLLAMAGIDAKAADARESKVRAAETTRRALADEWEQNNAALNTPGASANERFKALESLARIDPQQYGAQFERMRNNASQMGSVNEERTRANLASKAERDAAAAEAAAAQLAFENEQKQKEFGIKEKKQNLDEKQFEAGEARATRGEKRDETKEETRQRERMEDLSRNSAQRLEDIARAAQDRQAQWTREDMIRSGDKTNKIEDSLDADALNVHQVYVARARDRIAKEGAKWDGKAAAEILAEEMRERDKALDSMDENANVAAKRAGWKGETISANRARLIQPNVSDPDSFTRALNVADRYLEKGQRITSALGGVAKTAAFFHPATRGAAVLSSLAGGDKPAPVPAFGNPLQP